MAISMEDKNRQVETEKMEAAQPGLWIGAGCLLRFTAETPALNMTPSQRLNP